MPIASLRDTTVFYSGLSLLHTPLPEAIVDNQVVILVLLHKDKKTSLACEGTFPRFHHLHADIDTWILEPRCFRPAISILTTCNDVTASKPKMI